MNDDDFSKIWKNLTVGKSQEIDGQMFWKDEDKLYREKKLCIPEKLISKGILWVHDYYGHPGEQKTLWHFWQHFYAKKSAKELHDLARNVLTPCNVCCKAKPNSQVDRGLVGALPIPQLVNYVVFC